MENKLSAFAGSIGPKPLTTRVSAMILAATA